MHSFKTKKGKVLNVEDKDSSWVVSYDNPVYKNSPHVMPTSFSKKFSIAEVLSSIEVQKFLTRFDDQQPDLFGG